MDVISSKPPHSANTSIVVTISSFILLAVVYPASAVDPMSEAADMQAILSRESSEKSLKRLREEECVKAVASAKIDALLALGTAILAIVVGGTVTYFWTSRQKSREFELSSLNNLYRAFGEFLAVRRIWNQYKDGSYTTQEKQDTLFTRSAEIEATIEALVIQIASERTLNTAQTDDLGGLRQAFQSLREHIREDRKLSWGSSDHEQSVAFKDKSARVCQMLLPTRLFTHFRMPSANIAATQIKNIMDNKHEGDWKALAGEELCKLLKRYLSEIAIDPNDFNQRLDELFTWVSSDEEDTPAPDWFTFDSERDRIRALWLDSGQGWVEYNEKCGLYFPRKN